MLLFRKRCERAVPACKWLESFPKYLWAVFRRLRIKAFKFGFEP
jgi:hypothetical protein